MMLLTKEIKDKLRKAPLGSQDGKPLQNVIVKFFTPDSNWTWYATEGEEQEDGDWQFFGLVEGLEKELGYFNLSELQSAKGPMGLAIERDMYFEDKVLDVANNRVISKQNAKETEHIPY